MVEIVQVSPNFPPTICGVGDYAARLACALEALNGSIATVVANENPTAEHGVSLFGVRSSRALSDALTATGAKVVLVHFSPYGYARWGLCQWLVVGLRQWKQSNPFGRIVTIFHEVFATGPFWRTSFWTSRMQRSIAYDIARISDKGFVTSQAGYEQLQALEVRLSLEMIPVFSNVGEPEKTKPLFSRNPVAVVFGGANWRMRAYVAANRKGRALTAAFDRVGVTEVIDIGPAGIAPPILAGRPLRALGTLTSAAVSEWLGEARLGLMDYPRQVFTKSGIAAAYFAHGVLVVNTSRTGQLPNDLVEGREFATLDRLGRSDAEPQTIAAAGQDWYKRHGLDVTARRILNDLF